MSNIDLHLTESQLEEFDGVPVTIRAFPCKSGDVYLSVRNAANAPLVGLVMTAEEMRELIATLNGALCFGEPVKLDAYGLELL